LTVFNFLNRIVKPTDISTNFGLQTYSSLQWRPHPSTVTDSSDAHLQQEETV